MRSRGRRPATAPDARATGADPSFGGDRVSDILFRGGRVFLAAEAFAEAVLVRDGRISAVGGESDLVRLAAPGHETVDLDGGLLTPGFTDAHIHPVQAGLERARCDLSEAVRPAASTWTRIAAYAGAHPDRAWIDGGGWDDVGVPRRPPPPRRSSTVLDRPVYLIQPRPPRRLGQQPRAGARRHHRDTPDPADGRIERDADGTPSGMLHEGAMDLVGLLTPRPTAEDYDAALLEAPALPVLARASPAGRTPSSAPTRASDDRLPDLPVGRGRAAA